MLFSDMLIVDYFRESIITNVFRFPPRVPPALSYPNRRRRRRRRFRRRCARACCSRRAGAAVLRSVRTSAPPNPDKPASTPSDGPRDRAETQKR